MLVENDQEILCGASSTTIHGGTFAVVGHDMHIHSTGSKHYGFELLLANIAEGAFHNAAERGDPPRCHPHTRTAILEEITTWIRAPTAHRKFILWLYGPAGAGKTAIMQTIAEEAEKAGLLAASFFFSRTAAERNNSSRFVATLAYQLSRSMPEIREPILAAIEDDPTIFSRTLSVQMQTLVIDPLASFTGPIRQGPQVVVVDGVDEAGPNSEKQAELLHVLGAAVPELCHIPIIFLISSRPEYEIRLAFNTNPLSSLMKGLVLDDKYNPDADIKHYFESNFQKIREKQLAVGTPLPSPWPTQRDLDRLVVKSSGQFIFASTVIKSIDSPRRHPAKCLDIILGLSDPGKETPFAQLDALYHFILSSVDDHLKVLEVLTLLILADDYKLRVCLVDEFLGYEVRRVLVDMHALVFVPPATDTETELHIFHASLADFLMDRSRSRDFFIDVKQGHITIGQRWLAMVANYSHSKRSDKCSLDLQIAAFVGHCRKLPSGELADCLASFNLRALLEKIGDAEDLYRPDWHQFMIACEEQQPNTWFNISTRLQNEFHAFILDRLSQYPPSFQIYIPVLLIIGLNKSGRSLHDVHTIFLILLHSASRSETEFAQIQDLDGRLLHIRNYDLNRYFGEFFHGRMNYKQYQSSYIALLKEIVRVIRPKPGDAKIHVAVEDVEILLRHDSIFLTEFSSLLLPASPNSDLAYFLRERALQYRYNKDLDQRRRCIAVTSFQYVQKCGIPYLEHTHPQDTNRCIICQECPDASLWDYIPPTLGSGPKLIWAQLCPCLSSKGFDS